MDEQSSLIALAAKLRGGWPHASTAAEDFADRLARILGAQKPLVQVEENHLWFTWPLDSVKMRGFADLIVVIAGGDIARESIASIKRIRSGRDFPLVVLCLSDDSYLIADAAFPRIQGYIVAEPHEANALLHTTSGAQWVKGIARQQLARARLNPFGVLTPPDSNMFIGRQHELDQLYHSAASFAIAGPGRIGKSSLVQQHCRRVRTSDSTRYRRVVLVDFYNCDPLEETTVCRHLTTQINSNKYAHEATPEKLERFLRHEGADSTRGGPLELILDEVDEVCHTKTFECLAEAAKNRVCRLILCGKHELYESMHTQNNVLRNRLQLMRLEPLSAADLKTLLIDTLIDLGFRISLEDQRDIVDTVYDDTAGYPHLIQYYGVSLVERALRLRTDSITVSMVEDLRGSYEALQTLAGPILDIKDPAEELLALLLVSECTDSFSEHEFSALSAREGVRLDEHGMGKLCRKLYINNVITWVSTDRYHVTSSALSRSAARLGFLSSRLNELRADTKRG